MEILGVFALFAVIVLVWYIWSRESFDTGDRAQKIYNAKSMFANKDLAYDEYRAAMNHQVDALEFLALKELYRSGNFTPQSIAKELRDIKVDAH